MNHKNYINNEWVDAKDGKTFDVENPFTEEIIAQVPRSKEVDVDVAVQAAKAAWCQAAKTFLKFGFSSLRGDLAA